MSTRRRGLAGLVAALAALSITACGEDAREPCTQADLDQPAEAEIPAGVRVTATRRLNGERLDPLPASLQPAVTAGAARRRLSRARPSTGGGGDELLLGLFTARGYARVPAWVLFTSHLAQRLDPLPVQPGVEPRADRDVCAWVDVLTVLDAETGERFYGSTVTSAGRRPIPTSSTPAGSGL